MSQMNLKLNVTQMDWDSFPSTISQPKLQPKLPFNISFHGTTTHLVIQT